MRYGVKPVKPIMKIVVECLHPLATASGSAIDAIPK
jgi:hypothetical protein